MKTVILIDSFKGSLSSFSAGNAVKRAIQKVYTDSQVVVMPLADGGEGTVDALVEGLNGVYRSVSVLDPLSRPITAKYGIVNGDTAVIEMSSASGITLITDAERNPLNTTTYGVGQMIKDAIDYGCRKFIVGIGGSATNDGGLGMLTALGYKFYDKTGNTIGVDGKSLENISSIDDKEVINQLKECEFMVACDVENPLCGENGCSAIYGPQKGATPEIVKVMDGWLERFADLTKKTLNVDYKNFAGVGAAGGLGFALKSYLGANLQSGISLILNCINAEEQIKDADFVVTGEGRLDGQSAMGKAPVGVAKLAKKYGKKVIAFSGCTGDGVEKVNANGIDAYFPILQKVVSLETAMDVAVAKINLEKTAEQVFRLIKTIE
ncbi:MAG: glycerate kinase [Clostridia bacterium]|nr:glycerate kinase [Clostridia bacterium]